MTTGAPRICFVTTYPLDRHDLGGSGWIDRRLLDALTSVTTDVDVVCVTGPPGRRREMGLTVTSAGDVPLEMRENRAGLLRIGLAMMVSAEPYMSRKFTASRGWGDAADLLGRRAAGRLLITSGWPGLLLADAAGVPVDVHIAHNEEAAVARQHSPAPLRLLREPARMRRTERRLLASVDRVLTLSRRDAVALCDAGIPASPLPLPVVSRDAGSVGGRNAVGFIGKAAWPPNARALDQLLGPVHEGLSRIGADVPFVLAGVGTERFRGHPRVAAAGRVDDEADFYRQVGLVAVPRFGASTGVSVKMLEAAEYGVGSVVPSELAEAIDPDGPWLVADDVDQMVEQIRKWVAAPAGGDDATSWVARSRGAATVAAVLGTVQRADNNASASSGRNPESP